MDRVRELTRGGGAHVFECVGNNEEVVAQAYAATRRGGNTVLIGLPHPSKMFKVSIISMVGEERTVRGSYMGSAVPQRDIPRYIQLYLAGQLPVDRLVSRHISLKSLNAAFDALAQGEVVRQILTFK